MSREGHVPPPLAHLGGARPPAPEWFERALQQVPDRSHHTVQGAAIETLTWGRVCDPGVLLLHGNGAHADWYSFIGPLLAEGHRVAAMSWSGMGGSAWRDSYSLDTFVEEALAVAEAAGLFAGAVKPVFVGHSFGGFPTLACAARAGERLRAVVTVDTPILSREMREARRGPRDSPRELKPSRVYRTHDEALMRFRFQPPQTCEHLYIVDHIARTSLRPVTDEHGQPGWTWRFDPFLWRDYRMGKPGRDLAEARCPVALMRGERSKLVTPDVMAFAAGLARPGTPVIAIPDADHHVMVDQPLAFVAALRALMAGWP